MAAPDKPCLSHDFLELYRSYKRKTKIIVTWLQDTCKLEDLSLNSLITAANTVRKQKINVPSELYFVGKDALALRTEVAQQYKQVRSQGPDEGRQEANEKHEFFISGFRVMFQTLFPHPPADAMTTQIPTACKVDINLAPSSGNRYTALATAYDSHDSESVAQNSSPKVRSARTKSVVLAHKEHVPDTEERDYMIGDPIDDTVTFLEYAEEMDALLSDVKKIWEKAGNGTCTVMYAALYTKLSIECASYFTMKVIKDLELEDFQGLIDVHTDITMCFNPLKKQAGHPPVRYPQFSCEGAVERAVMIPLDAFIIQRSAPKASIGKVIKATDFLLSPTSMLPCGSLRDALTECRDPMVLVEFAMRGIQLADHLIEYRARSILMMLQDMDRYRTAALCASKKTCSRLLNFCEIGIVDMQMRPLFACLDAFVACKGQEYTADCNIWLSFLYESYNSFLWRGSNTATTSNARLQLLRYLKEVVSALHCVIEMTKSEDDRDRFFNFSLMAAHMDRLTACPRWDLYSQAPFVNGMAMLQISKETMYMGINMWNEDGIAGLALHAYNLVLHKRVLARPIPILEKLCTLLHNAIFMSHRPTYNFRSAMFRCMGGKLHKAGKSKHPRSQNAGSGLLPADVGRDFFIDCPKNMPAVCGDDRRIKPEELSKVYALHANHYALGEALKYTGTTFSSKTKAAERARDEMRESDKDYDEEDRTGHAGRNIMRGLNHVLRGEINFIDADAFPVTRINPFAVYLLFRDILMRVWEYSKGGLLSAAELAEPKLFGPAMPDRVVDRGCAVIVCMMEAVDGLSGPKFVGAGKRARQVLGIRAPDPKVLMGWVAEAILEAVGEDGSLEKYMWKSL